MAGPLVTNGGALMRHKSSVRKLTGTVCAFSLPLVVVADLAACTVSSGPPLSCSLAVSPTATLLNAPETVTVKTAPGAVITISVRYPGAAASAKALKADSKGVARFTFASGTRPGKVSVVALVARNGSAARRCSGLFAVGNGSFTLTQKPVLPGRYRGVPVAERAGDRQLADIRRHRRHADCRRRTRHLRHLWPLRFAGLLLQLQRKRRFKGVAHLHVDHQRRRHGVRDDQSNVAAPNGHRRTYVGSYRSSSPRTGPSPVPDSTPAISLAHSACSRRAQYSGTRPVRMDLIASPSRTAKKM